MIVRPGVKRTVTRKASLFRDPPSAEGVLRPA